MADLANYQYPLAALTEGYKALLSVKDWNAVLSGLSSISAAKAFYFSLDPFLVLVSAALLVALYCYIASIITGDHSQVPSNIAFLIKFHLTPFLLLLFHFDRSTDCGVLCHFFILGSSLFMLMCSRPILA